MNPVHNALHNTTAHYNAYFIAKEHIKTIENRIHEDQEWNFDKILPVHPQFDSVQSKSFEKELEDCVIKSSMAIHRHKGSKWEDNSYTLVGKARFYGLDFPNAIETFKYINTTSKDDDERHTALIALMRTFIESKELKNAETVLYYLEKEKLNKNNSKDFYIMSGYFYQNRNDINSMISELSKAVPLLSSKREKIRIHLILGQAHHKTSNFQKAHHHYEQVLKAKPDYKIEFYTKINYAQVAQIDQEYDIKKTNSYFSKLLKDRKNEMYRDKIYYELGNFELRKHNLELALSYYNQSIRASTDNHRQKGLSYLRMGEIYFDSLRNYKLSKLYYDSTLSTIPKNEESYSEIETRKIILENFVKQITTIELNDSLLHLVSLPEDELIAILNKKIEAEINEEEEDRKRKKASANNNTTNTFINTNNETTFSGFTEGDKNALWYFYNPALVNKGKFDFNSQWGNRDLNDYWRISSKITQINIKKTDSIETQDDTQTVIEKDEDQEKIIDQRRTELMAKLPKTQEQQQILHSRLQEAYFNLGIIYKYDLHEIYNSNSTFEYLIEKYPEYEKANEVRYTLYLSYKDILDFERSDYYKNILLNNYPDDIHSKLIINPNYKLDTKIESDKLKKLYKLAYESFKAEDYDKAKNIIVEGLTQYTENDFVDNCQLLLILINAKIELSYYYESNLRRLLNDYPSSELIDYIQSLIDHSTQFQINQFNSSKAKYIKKLKTKHSIIYLLKNSHDKEENMNLIKYLNAKASNLKDKDFMHFALNEEYTVIGIDHFESKLESLQQKNLISEDSNFKNIFKSNDLHNFVISNENLKILYQTKEIDSYLEYYKNNYQL